MSAESNRATVIGRVRAALGVEGSEPQRSEAVASRLARHPRGTIPAQARGDRQTLLDRFSAALESQGAQVVHALTQADAVQAIASALDAYALPGFLRMGSDPLLRALPWALAPGIAIGSGKAEPHDKAALSRAVIAAAETGTLFLASGPDNPTTLAFLPEQHVVLVAATDIVGSYEDAFDQLRRLYGEGILPRSLNLVSGPSRTADIEQTIVRGAHGPKRLLVVILG